LATRELGCNQGFQKVTEKDRSQQNKREEGEKKIDIDLLAKSLMEHIDKAGKQGQRLRTYAI